MAVTVAASRARNTCDTIHEIEFRHSFLDANLLASILTAVFLIALYWFLDFKDFYDKFHKK